MNTNLRNPLVSVLMTSFNRENYIAEAIQSVLNSTYPHWELIIVDDGSTDQTLKIAHGFAAKDSRIHVYANEKNLGDYPNRNKAAGYAKGEYLKYVDSDDLIYPFGLASMVYFMEQYPEAGYGLGQLPANNERPYPILLSPAAAYEYNYFRNPIFIKSPLSAIIRKSIFIDSGGFPIQRMTSDYEMWHRLSLKYPVLLMPQGLVWYRKHGDQEVKIKDEYTFQYLKISYRYLLNDACPLNENKKKALFKKLSNYKYTLLYRSVQKGRYKDILKILQT